MEKQVFREKSLERIASPEQLHDYMRVTSPKLWMILTAAIVLVVGFVVAASVFTMENSRDLQVSVNRSEEQEPFIMFSLPLKEKDVIEVGMPVEFGGYQGKVESIFQDSENVNGLVELGAGQKTPAEGTYDGKVIIERVNPISFLLN